MGGLWQDLRHAARLAGQEARRSRDHGRHARAGHRRDDGHLQRRLRRAAAAAAVSRREPDHGRLRGQREGPAVAPGGPELRRLPRSEPQLPGDREVQRLRHVRLGSFAAHADGRRARVVRLPEGLRRPADPRARFRRRRREEGSGADRPRQRSLLEAAPRIAAGPFAGAPEDRRSDLLRHRRAPGRIPFPRRGRPLGARRARRRKREPDVAQLQRRRAPARRRDGRAGESRHQRDRAAHPRRRRTRRATICSRTGRSCRSRTRSPARRARRC